jgi:hypothetical protein
MPRDPFIREKFTRERTAAKKLAAEYFERFPKDRYKTEVESWRNPRRLMLRSMTRLWLCRRTNGAIGRRSVG